MVKSTTPFAALATLAERLETIRARKALAQTVGDTLKGLASEEIAPAVRLILGQVFPEWDERALNLSWQTVMAVIEELTEATPAERQAAFREAADAGEAVKLLLGRHRREPPRGPPLTIADVYQTLGAIAETSGRGSRARKAALLRDLLGRCSAAEAKLLAKNIFGEMRHGVGEGLMLEAIAHAADVKLALVRRANMLWGDLGEVARAALTEGEPTLARAGVRLMRPMKPMLASTAEDMAEVFARHRAGTALEHKLDGARVQIHKRGREVRIFSRRLSDVTPSLPEIVTAIREGVAAREAVLDGEVVAEDTRGRPLPFQDLMRRFRRQHDVEVAAAELPVHLYAFDLLYRDGETLIDRPNRQRWAALTRVAQGIDLVERLEPRSEAEGERFLRAAYEAGHEGVVAKDVNSPYRPGQRGKAWLKLKHVETLDCVIVAADWGYGRRKGWLSNYHLAVRDAEGGFALVGKTFKGPTDAEFQAMTERLLALKRAQRGATVFVEPRIVVEVAFNEIQASPHYRSGYALRFARIVRVREDKGPAQADTLERLEEMYERQFRFKGRFKI